MKRFLILWTSIIYMTALMEIVAVPHTQQQKTDALQDIYNSEVPLFSTNRIDSPNQFPEEDVEYFQKLVDSPKCAEGSTYCEDVDSYPLDVVQRLLKNTTYTFHESSDDDTSIEVEIKHSDDEEVPCKSSRRYVRPRVGQLAFTDEWMYIVNDEEHKQYVQIEECRHTDECHLEDVGDFAPCLGYQCRCKQNTLNVEMLAVLPNGKFVAKRFRMPSLCQCVFKRTEKWRALDSCHN